MKSSPCVELNWRDRVRKVKGDGRSPMIFSRHAALVVSLVCLNLSIVAQNPDDLVTSKTDQEEQSFLLRSYSRVVTLEVVVKDSKGRHVTGLKPRDFQVYEQTPDRHNDRREQKIVAFREVSLADLTGRDSAVAPQIPKDLFTNVMVSLKDGIPPTIILVDGLNTDERYQAQIYVQMLKMLRQLPPDVPVAVFLLGRKLVMLQDFTSDPKLLQVALSKAITSDGQNLAQLDPSIDPDSTLNLLLKSNLPIPAEMLAAARSQDQRSFSQQMDIRVQGSVEAFESIARHMSGYPGRKNLLWISTAFPLSIVNPNLDQPGARNYLRAARQVTSALSNAKIAVYPMNPAGVVAIPEYMPESTPLPSAGDPFYKPELEREMEQGNTMRSVAEATGGAACIGNNDLADCVHKAIDDSSKFYEIAYHPESKDWNGEYRHITLVTKTKGLKLEYRQGYFASPDASEDLIGSKNELQRAACDGAMDATSIFLAAKSLPPDPDRSMKFHLVINPAALTFVGSDNDSKEVKLLLGICTFDNAGKPLHYMSDDLVQRLKPVEYRSVITGGLQHVVSIAGPKPAAVRLAVMDLASGRLGSVRVATREDATRAPSN